MARSNPAHAPEGPGRRAGRRVAAVATAVAVVAGGAYGAMALRAHGEARHAKPAGAPTARTTVVSRGDLSNTRTLPGTLGYGAAATVKGTGTGTVTKLPANGAKVTRGKPLYWVNDWPVMVFYGGTPMFRPLDAKAAKAGASGSDVTVLADNLKALGYDIGPEERTTHQSSTAAGSAPGTRLTPSLLAALKRWQRDTGQQQTGALEVGRVAVLPGPVRVGGLKAQPGEPAAEDLLSVTSEQKSVTVKADAGDAMHQGDPVTITLPDTTQVPGKVASVGTTVQGGAGGEADPSGGDTPPTVQVTVVPSGSAAIKGLDAASVQVAFTTETRKNVLVVPVGALLALQEGGYALQRPDGQLVAVKTGLFARGRVEVSGAGVEAGDRVVTAS